MFKTDGWVPSYKQVAEFHHSHLYTSLQAGEHLDINDSTPSHKQNEVSPKVILCLPASRFAIPHIRINIHLQADWNITSDNAILSCKQDNTLLPSDQHHPTNSWLLEARNQLLIASNEKCLSTPLKTTRSWFGFFPTSNPHLFASKKIFLCRQIKSHCLQAGISHTPNPYYTASSTVLF